uniref:Nuclear pore complex protein Nup98-Nup96 n=1 Tax=Romanomermis culicivorax TaxID=13658 RepID=A0A915KRE8_ROMCU
MYPDSPIIPHDAFLLPGLDVTSSTPFIKYAPPLGMDTIVRNDTLKNIYTKHHCISAMNEYENKSLEELRLENYTRDHKVRKPPKFGPSVLQEIAILSSGYTYEFITEISFKCPPRSRKFNVASRHEKQNFGNLDDDLADKLTFKPSFSYGAPQKYKSVCMQQLTGRASPALKGACSSE